MNTGPCLSPISIAVQNFHRGKKKPSPCTLSEMVNPILSKRAAYSPPMRRRSKLKRSRSFLDDFTERPEDRPPPAKKQKVVADTHDLAALPIGSAVRARFSQDIELTASIFLVEKFGVQLLVLEEHWNLPEVRRFSKHWAKWSGDTCEGTPVLHIIHQASA